MPTVSSAGSTITLGSFLASTTAYSPVKGTFTASADGSALTVISSFVCGSAASAVVSMNSAIATVHIAVLHGAGNTYPRDFLPVNVEAGLTRPALPPNVTAANGSGTLTAGTWWVSYAYTNCTDLGSPLTALANGTTLPSPPASVTLGANQILSVSAPSAWPIGTTAIRWYVASGTDQDARLLTATSTTVGTTLLTTPGTAGSTENTTDTTLPAGLSFGRSDDESGGEPIPIQPTAPFSTYSWYKILQLTIPQRGTSTSSLSRFTVRGGSQPTGMALYYRVPGSYVLCNGLQGTASGNYPADNEAARVGNAPNTPSGYAVLSGTEVVFDAGSHAASSVGGIGALLQLVAGVADRSSTGNLVGSQTSATLIFGYDET